MRHLHKIFWKEFNAYFASPAAWLFMGAFLIVTLFVFFWGEAFFARNVADMKPFFNWIPVLLIFLVGTLSMRTWSEERRSGTIESLLTSPVGSLQIVLGKFLANLALVALALLLTVPLAISVSVIGPLDWGPVIGGYVASLFLAAAYVAIGLYMSSRTDNPIVALILTVACAGAFYLVGSSMLTTLVSHNAAGLLELLGSGSRFDSITRGVLDLRDLYYYVSIVGIFLTLNLLSLERLRWAGNPSQKHHRRWQLFTLLVVANFLVANVWLNSVRWARIDLTDGNVYSLSSVTEDYLNQAVEPLLIRGYFSKKSHPLLEPLVPRIKDLLEEYQVAGGSNVRIEFVDPHSDQDIEEEAADKYGIRPVPFRMASRYEAGVVNSYFDLVVAYGDQYEVLSFNDLIEVKSSGSGEPEVLLNNPEYAISGTVKKVISGYRAEGDVYTDLTDTVLFHAYVSPAEQLPDAFAQFRGVLETTLRKLSDQSGGKLVYEFTDPGPFDGRLAQQLNEVYGFVPQVAGLFDTQPFWFYMLLEAGSNSVLVPLPEDLDEDGISDNIEASLKRLSPGYMKTIGIVAPEAPPQQNPYMPMPARKSFNDLRTALEENVRVIDADLSSGTVPADIDMLILLSPEYFSEMEVFAVDQFLMQGGSVAIMTSPYDAMLSSTISLTPFESGLSEWLSTMGVTIGQSLVMDPLNASLPLPVPRQVGPITVNEIVMMPYPHFPDVRRDGLDEEHPLTAGLEQLSFNWVSPMTLNPDANSTVDFTVLAQSSEASWRTTSLNALPDYALYPQSGFASGEDRGRSILAIAGEGRFQSFFKDKDSPLLPDKPDDPASSDDSANEDEGATVYGSVIQNSSDSAKLVVIGSNSFAEDTALSMSSRGIGVDYTVPLEFVQNIVDWSLEDAGLLEIRGRNQLARTLYPMDTSQLRTVEYINYAMALAGLFIVWAVRRLQRQKRQARHQLLAEEI